MSGGSHCPDCDGRRGLMDIDELADWLGVPRTWVRDKVTARSIPITWVGKHARFSQQDRDELLAAGKERPHLPEARPINVVAMSKPKPKRKRSAA